LKTRDYFQKIKNNVVFLLNNLLFYMQYIVKYYSALVADFMCLYLRKNKIYVLI